MHPFLRLALFSIARDTFYVALAAAILMAAFCFELELALVIGASIALVFALGILLRVIRLDDERVVHIEAWRLLAPEERPQGSDGRSWARDNLEDLWLNSAKLASGAAATLYCSALAASFLR
jgi:hypothetical protein